MEIGDLTWTTLILLGLVTGTAAGAYNGASQLSKKIDALKGLLDTEKEEQVFYNGEVEERLRRIEKKLENDKW